MPKILHIINRLGLGGAEVMLLDIIRNSNRAEFDYHILLPHGKGELDNRAASFSIPLHYLLEGEKSGRFNLLREGIAFLKNFKPNIIISHTRFSDLIGLYGGSKAGIPLRIMTVHAAGMYFYDSWPIHEGIAEYFVSRFAKHYVAVSREVIKYLQKYGNIPSEKITLIPNGIDPDRVCKTDIRNRDDVRKSLGFGKNQFVVLSVGRLIQAKGFDILLEEFANFAKKATDASLLIAGYGPEQNKLIRKTSRLKIADRAKFIGQYPNLSELLKSCDCYVMPSRQEGFGLSILEAMANGLPVIGNKVGAVPEIIENGVNGLSFSIRNKGELASRILDIYNDKKTALMYGENARKTALEKYHVKNTSQKYEELYRKLLS